MGNGGELVRTQQKRGDIGGSKGTDSDGRDKAKVGVAGERYCQKGPESLEHQGGMAH